MLRDRDGIHRY